VILLGKKNLKPKPNFYEKSQIPIGEDFTWSHHKCEFTQGKGGGKIILEPNKNIQWWILKFQNFHLLAIKP